MNWYRRYKVASFPKVAYPYSSNLCPNCSIPLLLDFYWERHHRNIGLGIGKCPSCKQGIKADLLPYRKVENKEEKWGFRFSNLSPLTSIEFKRLQQQGTPEILVVEDNEGMAVQPTVEGERVNTVEQSDPMEGEEGNPLMPSTSVAAASSSSVK